MPCLKQKDSARTMASNPDGLGKTAARGAAVTMLGQVLKLAVQLGGIIVLARLLSPEDFGLIAMVTAIVGVGELVRDFGLSSAALQSKKLSEQQQSNLFWINTGIGAALMVIVLSTSAVVADFYGRQEVRGIMIAIAVTFLLSGLATQFRVRLNRALLFGRLATIDVCSQLAGISAAAIAATNDWGYYSLVVQILMQTTVATTAAVIVPRWLPMRPRRTEGMRSLLRFGANLVGTQFITNISRNIDSVIIGARFGSTQLGLYDRAFQIVSMPLNQVQAPATTVALPILSRLHNGGDKQRYDAYLLRGQNVLIHLIMLPFTVVWVSAEWLVTSVFGPQWESAVVYVRILLIAGVAQAAAYASYWVFLSKSLTGANFRFTLVTRTALCGMVLLGALWSAQGVAIGYTVGTALIWPLGLVLISRISDAPAMKMFTSGVRALACYTTASMVAVLIPLNGLDLAPFAEFFVRSVVVFVVVALCALIFPAVRRDAMGIVEVAAMVRGRSR